MMLHAARRQLVIAIVAIDAALTKTSVTALP
jgi:hypothetical protein